MVAIVQGGAGPVASIVVISDFHAGEPDSWADVADVFRCLAAQDFLEPVEVLLVCATEEAAKLPPDLRALLPGVQIVSVGGVTSYDLKNAGAVAAAAEIVFLLDADCSPVPGWLTAAMRHLREHPQAVVVSGRTTYKGAGADWRIMAMLDRGYVEPGGSGTTRAISNNNAAFRRDTLLRHPLANDIGPFGSRPHADNILAEGGELRFEPGMVAAHGFAGWAMVRDIRFGQGFAAIRYRQLRPETRYGTIVAMGFFGLPILVAGSVVRSWWDCLRLWREFQVPLTAVPLALAIAVVMRAFELPGMIAALRQRPVGSEATAYR